MDGTLVSSLPLIHYCVNEISQKYVNRGRTVQDVVNSFGPPAHEIIRSLTRDLDPNLQNRAVGEYYRCYRDNVSKKAMLFEGIPSLLSDVRESGRQLALVTGVERVLMDYTLNSFDLSKYFETKVSRDDVTKGKPDPEGAMLALSRLGVNPDKSLFVGDAPADIRAGKRAGTATGAALWSPENIGDPRMENPDFVFRSVAELSALLLNGS